MRLNTRESGNEAIQESLGVRSNLNAIIIHHAVALQNWRYITGNYEANL